MAFIRSLQLTHFRCYETARLDGLTSGPVVLTGPNGAGKTNVLDAVYYLCLGKSYFSSGERMVIPWRGNASGVYLITVADQAGNMHTQRINIERP